MKPSPFELFCLYQLGLDRDFQYKFRNLHEAARYFGTSPGEVEAWLKEYGMDPATVGHVDYNLPSAHAEAQVLSLTAATDNVRAFAEKTFQDFRASLSTYDPTRFRQWIDWDALDKMFGKPKT